jgi:hypothetical protein
VAKEVFNNRLINIKDLLSQLEAVPMEKPEA